MSSHLSLPCEGHLDQALHILAYLKNHHNEELVFDPTYPEIDESTFDIKDWTTSEFGNVQGKEELPPNHPEARGDGFVKCFPQGIRESALFVECYILSFVRYENVRHVGIME